jgi:hypothetical protein
MYCYVDSVHLPGAAALGEKIIPVQKAGLQPEGAQIDKLVHLALPVRLIHMPNGERGGLELVCTYDIHPRGARLRSSRDMKVGDLVTVERGRYKSICQVVWVAGHNSPLRGQFTVECVEGNRTPWDDELRLMDEQYLPVIADSPNRNSSMNAFRHTEQNRRRRPRFPVSGGANVAEIGGLSQMVGRLEEISEFGCLISSSDLLTPGTALKLVLNMCDVSIALRGHVRYTARNQSMGVEFQEIRQGDRPLLTYVLNQLKRRRANDFSDLEVITEHLAAAAVAG